MLGTFPDWRVPMAQRRSRCAAPLRAGDVLPALQLALEHGHERGWEAVRLSRPNGRLATEARLPRIVHDWHEVVVLSCTRAGQERRRRLQWSVPPDALMLIRRGSDPPLL
jgi:hypothetical protein